MPILSLSSIKVQRSAHNVNGFYKNKPVTGAVITLQLARTLILTYLLTSNFIFFSSSNYTGFGLALRVYGMLSWSVHPCL